MADEIVLTDENIPPMQDELFRLYSQGFLTDITLSCEDGKNFEAHRVLLAARSQYFYGIVPKLKVEPVIFLKGVKGNHLEKILKYIYSGTATVSRSQLKPILEVARSLQVKGLQELAPTELSRGTNTSYPGHSSSKYSGSGSPVPSKGKDDSYHSSHSKHSPQNARDIALQQQQKLYDKISLSTKKSPSSKNNSIDKSSDFSSNKKSKQFNSKDTIKSMKDDENGEEVFKFQYQYISDDSDEDKDDSNDSDFEVKDKKNSKELVMDLNSKKKKGKTGKENDNSSMIKSKRRFGKDDSDSEFQNCRKGSKSSSDEDTDNSSDLDHDDSDSESDSDDASGSGSGSDDDEEDDKTGSRSLFKKMESPRPYDKSSANRRKDLFEGSPSASPASSSPRRGRGPTINGKQMLPVQCKGKRAELHLSKFGNGTNGKSIKYKNVWMTPEDYELACGIKSKKYLESITTDYGPLKTLTASGLLKPHPKKCKCNVCMDEEITSPETKNVSKEERENNRTKKDSDKVVGKKRDGSPLVNSDSDKKKKFENAFDARNKSQSSQSRQLSSKTSRDRTATTATTKSHESAASSKPSLASTISPSKLSPSISKTDIISPATLSSTKTNTSSLSSSPSVSTSSTFSPSSSKPLASPSFIAMTPVTSLNSLPPLTTNSSAIPSTVTFASKFSSSPQSTLSPTTYSNTSHTQNLPPINTTLPQTPNLTSPSTSSFSTSTHSSKSDQRTYSQAPSTSMSSLASPTLSKAPNNLANSMGPPPSIKPPDPLQMMGNMQQPSPGLGQMSPHQTNVNKSGHGQGQGRIGQVMQVRCKSLSALLYVSKYESGSKGKCILVGEEWMTPNEFEEKAGSKAKKYLSSIKCLGRPLRAFVNSGELRGTGPTPSPKPPKINKPKPPQPIAPAPAPGQSPGYTMPPPGMSPAHMSANMPQSLTQVAMMGGGSVGQPILLNQAVSIAGQSSMNQVGTQLLQPMTFTFAPMSMQGQQLQHQQLQHQQLHGTSVAQQLHGSHSSTDYILQHK